MGFFQLSRGPNFFTPKPNNINFYGSHITRGSPNSAQSENLSIIGEKMTILWPFSLFLHPPPRGPYLPYPNAPGPVLRPASRGHVWLTHIQNWLMGKSPSLRYSASKSVNFPDSHYRDTPTRALGWYFPPLWLTSRYPRHDQKHQSTCGRPCSGIKVRVLGTLRQYS